MHASTVASVERVSVSVVFFFLSFQSLWPPLVGRPSAIGAPSVVAIYHVNTVR